MKGDCRKGYFAKRAFLSEGWADNVHFTVENGLIRDITPNSNEQYQDVLLSGPVLPTLANLHSHAFQRVMAGVAEVNLNPNDSFWSWRDLMYRVVQKLTPIDVQVIATQLYIDMLKAGYSQVGEFHYLHHEAGGLAYQRPEEMALQLLHAADLAGIGMTLLPVLYSHSGFGGRAPNVGQLRFIHSSDSYLALHNACEKAIYKERSNGVRHKLGICFHSLRAVTKVQIETVLAGLNKSIPIHIHIAEQQKEVEDCLHWSGLRPVQWLHNEIGLDERWCLVHATHLDNSELNAIAESNSVAGLCPSTEANLGDGIFPAVEYGEAKGRWGIGSDSHVSLSITDELRSLEYSQRLRDQQRNRLYCPEQQFVGDYLFQQALQGGNQACDVSLGLAIGNRADFMVLDGEHPFIEASESKDLINRWIFACNEKIVKDVFVAGEQVVFDFKHKYEESSRKAFVQVIRKIIY